MIACLSPITFLTVLHLHVKDGQQGKKGDSDLYMGSVQQCNRF